MTPSLQHEIKKKKPFDLPEQEAFLNVVRTASTLAADFERLFRDHGLSEATYNVLRILRGHGALGEDRVQVCDEVFVEHVVAQRA